MRWRRWFGGACGVLLVLSGADPVPGQGELPDPDPGTFEARVDAFLEPYIEMEVFSGSLLVGRGDEVLLAKGYGLADRDHGVPNTAETRFPIASVSKAFTAVAMVQLMQAGEFGPDAPVSRFVPDFPRGDEITVLHLFQERSGVPHINELPWYERESRFHHSLDELVERIAAEPLSGDPGTDTGYSNGAYVLMAKIIEEVSGLSYGEYMGRHVFEPAGMERSGHLDRPRVVEDMAEGYAPGVDGLEPAPWYEPSIKIGGGSLYSTVRDLWRFDRAMAEKRLIDQSAISGSDPSPWGPEMIEHEGRTPGYTAMLLRFPDESLTVVSLGNNYSRAYREVAYGVAALALGREPEVREPIRPVTLSGDALARLEGSWELVMGPRRLEVRDGTPVLVDEVRRSAHALLPLGPRRLVSPLLWATLEFDAGPGPPRSGTLRSLNDPDSTSPFRRISESGSSAGRRPEGGREGASTSPTEVGPREIPRRRP